ncbi:MAG TPA: 4Fe-4S binding protein [Candidatus Bathyarchaeia archaeon]|nr:4Fe-4S binding protein [Candidatus Bathyarchaeia archaeon]
MKLGDGIKQKLLKYNTFRRIIQLLSLIFLSGVVFNLGVLPLLLPVLWTWGLSPNTAGDAFTAIQLMLGGWQNLYFVFPWLAVASFLLIGILIGKSFCGWVCPFGFIQDLIGFVKRKKMEFSPRTHDNALYVKYGVLGATLFISLSYAASEALKTASSYKNALGIFATAPFTALSPAETLFGILPRLVRNFVNDLFAKPVLDVLSGVGNLSPLFWVQFALLVSVLVFAALFSRGWCRYMCPHGAIMAVLNKFSFIGLRREPIKCSKATCRRCVEVCPMRVPILDLPWEKFSHEECIYCMKCADACEDKAIKLTYP